MYYLTTDTTQLSQKWNFRYSLVYLPPETRLPTTWISSLKGGEKLKSLSVTQAYIVAFLLLAMWSTFAFLTMQNQIHGQERYAQLINISGKQRMLSQRTALLASQFFETQDLSYLEDLQHFSKLMREDHQFLLSNIPSEHLRQIYYDQPNHLAVRVAGYLDQVNHFIAHDPQVLSTDIFNQANRLLPRLDFAVNAYEAESRQKTIQLMRIERLILVGSLLTLILEALLILRPTLRKANLSMQQLEAMVTKKTSELQTQKETLAQLVKDYELEIETRKKYEQERRELELQLRQKYKMEALGTMAAGISHNFNNSLALVLGSLELALRKSPGCKIVDLLNQARVGVFQSRDLVKQLLAYSRQDSLEMQPVNLYELLLQNCQLLERTIPSSITIEKAFNPAAKNIIIHANSVQVQECLLNLCNNAVHAMDDRGNLTIGFDIAEVAADEIPEQYSAQPGVYAKLQVKDDGCGMNEQIKERAFDLFYTTKDPDEGTGMGLSTVQSIVRNHNGFIKILSQEGLGTTIELYFSLADQSSQAREVTEPTPLEIPRGDEHILLVDDDPQVVMLSEEILKGLGYQVTKFSDSLAALENFRLYHHQYQLLITDQTMPKLTGRNLVKEIRTIRPDFPAILYTGFSKRIDRDQALKEGINDYLEKPLSLYKLASAVRNCLDSYS